MVNRSSEGFRRIALACLIVLGAFSTLQAADPPADPIKEAETYKKLGDEHASKDQVRLAADAYQHAFSLGRDQFTPDECYRMAVILSWDDRLSAAIRELKHVLERDPGHHSARIQLARIYSWDGQLHRAVRVADEVLAGAPGDKETLLVKANALEWDDRFDEAIAIYERLIERDGDFYAKIGLASSTLYKGDRASAQREARTLVATDARQRRQLQRLSDAIARETRPRMEIGYDYYSDSDENHFGRYAANYSFAAGNHDFSVILGRTDVDDGSRSDDASVHADFNASGAIGLAAGIGVTRLHGTERTQFPSGSLRLHARSRRTTFSATVASETLNETSELISNRVRRLSSGAEVSQKLTSNWSIGGAFTRYRFSDSNDANDGQVRTEYSVHLSPRISFGYQLRFVDYDMQSGSGYFDPTDFVSHRASVSLELDRRKFFVFLQIYGGHQEFVRHAYETSEWVKGGRASFGVKFSPKFSLSVNTAAGDFSTGSVSGYRYFTAGTKVSYRF